MGMTNQYSPTTGCDHLSSATSFPKYQKIPSQITIFGIPSKLLQPLLELNVWNFPLF